MLRKRKGNMLIECMVGVFIVMIATTIGVTLLSEAFRGASRRREVQIFNENLNFLISEIKYNEPYCEIAKLYDGNEKITTSFNGEYLELYKGKKELNTGNISGEKGSYEVEVASKEEDYFLVKISYNLEGKGKISGEEYFKKYRFMESQEEWIYSN